MASSVSEDKGFKTFSDFYPFYIHEHRNTVNRRLHIIGTTFALLCWVAFFYSPSLKRFFLPLLVGYGFAWVGHFFFEKNKPATFKYPLWSFMGDFRMFFETITGQRAF